MKKPTISEIKQLTFNNSPYFFTKDTLRFFGQKMSNFKVYRHNDDRIYIYANRIKDFRGDIVKGIYSLRELVKLKDNTYDLGLVSSDLEQYVKECILYKF